MSIQVDKPQPGFFWTRLVKGGPKVGARIWEGRDVFGLPVMLAEVNGKPADAAEVWNYNANHRITEAEYRFLVADTAHAVAHRPDDPKATPDLPIDPLRCPIPF